MRVPVRPVGLEAARWLDAQEVVAGALLPTAAWRSRRRRAGSPSSAPTSPSTKRQERSRGSPATTSWPFTSRGTARSGPPSTPASRASSSPPRSPSSTAATGLTGNGPLRSRDTRAASYVSRPLTGLFAARRRPLRRRALDTPRRFSRVDERGPGCFATASAGEDLLVATRAGLFVAGPGGIAVVPGTGQLAVYAVVPSLRFPGRFWARSPGRDRTGSAGTGRPGSSSGSAREAPGRSGRSSRRRGRRQPVWLGSVFGGVLRLRFAGAGGSPQVTPAGSPRKSPSSPAATACAPSSRGRASSGSTPPRPGSSPSRRLAAVARDDHLFLAAEDGLGNVWLEHGTAVLRDSPRRSPRRRAPRRLRDPGERLPGARRARRRRLARLGGRASSATTSPPPALSSRSRPRS